MRLSLCKCFGYPKQVNHSFIVFGGKSEKGELRSKILAALIGLQCEVFVYNILRQIRAQNLKVNANLTEPRDAWCPKARDHCSVCHLMVFKESHVHLVKVGSVSRLSCSSSSSSRVHRWLSSLFYTLHT